MDIPPLNKSCLLFSNLYRWDMPSPKELAFRLGQSFSILLEEIDYSVVLGHIYESFCSKGIHHMANTQAGWIFLSSCTLSFL